MWLIRSYPDHFPETQKMGLHTTGQFNSEDVHRAYSPLRLAWKAESRTNNQRAKKPYYLTADDQRQFGVADVLLDANKGC